MKLILHQDLQGEAVRKVEYPEPATGLQPGDVLVSENVLVKIQDYLKEKQQKNSIEIVT